MDRYEVFEDAGARWRWHLVAANGRIVSTSGESFDSRSNAYRAASDHKRVAAAAALPVRGIVRRTPGLSYGTVQQRPQTLAEFLAEPKPQAPVRRPRPPR